MDKDTRVDLVQELHHILPLAENLPYVAALRDMISEAKAGEYHDYKNQKYACGKMASHEFLENIGTPSAKQLAARIAKGEFDERPDDQDRLAIMQSLGVA